MNCYSDSDNPIEVALCFDGIDNFNFEGDDIKVICGEGGY